MPKALMRSIEEIEDQIGQLEGILSKPQKEASDLEIMAAPCLLIVHAALMWAAGISNVPPVDGYRAEIQKAEEEAKVSAPKNDLSEHTQDIKEISHEQKH